MLAKFSLFLQHLDPRLPVHATNGLSLALVIAAGVLDVLIGVAFLPSSGHRPLALLLLVIVGAAAAYAAIYVVPR